MPRGIDSKKGVQLAYRRFSAFHRFNHYLVMVSFFGLALTGMPLKFQDSFWSQLFINAVGGVEMAGLIHRVMAVANITYFLLESGYMVYYVLARKGPSLGRTASSPAGRIGETCGGCSAGSLARVQSHGSIGLLTGRNSTTGLSLPGQFS